MASRAISASAARHVLARVHGLAQPTHISRLEGVMSVFDRHQCVQSDPIDVAGRNADLTLQSRVVEYRQEYLRDLLYKERRLFEYFCKMHSIMPVELYPIFKRKMDAFWKEKRVVAFFRKHRKETRLVLRALEEGPVSSRELVDMGSMKSGWGHNTRVSNVILTRLWVSGKALIFTRNGAAKYYALPERVIPERLFDVDPPAKGEDIVEIAKIIANASRIVTAGGSVEQWWEIGGPTVMRDVLQRLEKRGDLFSFELEGSKDTFYAPAADKEEWNNPEPSTEDYVRFLAPLDPLIWSRRVFKTIYGTEYSWEVYKKEKDRKYGYYCLPIIYNDEYIGLLEPFFRKTDRVLEIRNLHIFDRAIARRRFLEALNREIDRFRCYLGAQELVVKQAPGWLSKGIMS